MPNWAGSDRRSRLPDNWAVLRLRILRRDGHRCTAEDLDGVRCPERATDVDHVRPGDDHRDTNLTSLCSHHHAVKSSREGAQALAAKKRRNAAKFDRRETHPALLSKPRG